MEVRGFKVLSNNFRLKGLPNTDYNKQLEVLHCFVSKDEVLDAEELFNRLVHCGHHVTKCSVVMFLGQGMNGHLVKEKSQRGKFFYHISDKGEALLLREKFGFRKRIR